MTAALGIPYVIAEPSISPRRRAGPWAGFAAASEAAIAHADRLLWATMRDRPALEEAGFGAKLRSLPPFLDPGDAIQPRPAGRPLRLLTIAMMRPGDKIDSYRRIAAALGHLSDWELTVIGGGEGESAVQALFEPHRPHVAFLGTLTDPRAVRAHAERADVFVWPGVGEGVGMVWLEAQAAGLPVVAEEGPAARALIGAGRLTPPGDAPAFARAIGEVAAQREQLSFRARAHVEAGHGLAAAARTLSSILEEVA
ncbi:MAG: glycosyltransferase [Pseudomonadota bacterium]